MMEHGTLPARITYVLHLPVYFHRANPSQQVTNISDSEPEQIVPVKKAAKVVPFRGHVAVPTAPKLKREPRMPSEQVPLAKSDKKSKSDSKSDKKSTKTPVLGPATVRVGDLPLFIQSGNKWCRVVIPTLVFSMFTAGKPFKDFASNSDEFREIVQAAVDKIFPDVSYSVSDLGLHDPILLLVSLFTRL
jgi:hypothetical protein